MTTAAPEAFSFAGRNTPMDGRWTFAVTCSPCGVVRTVSSPVLPSDPGAPFGQRTIHWGSAALAMKADMNSAQAKDFFIGGPRRIERITAGMPGHLTLDG